VDLTTGQAARHYNAAQLGSALTQARDRLKSLVNDLTTDQWNVPYTAGINPVAWEIAHVAWFAEWWTLRQGAGNVPARFAGPDALLDSSRMAHADRFTAALPTRQAAFAMLDGQLDATLEALAGSESNDTALYFFKLALFHEEMHNEALLWLRARQGYAAPADCEVPRITATGRAVVPAHEATVGQMPAQGGFFFDNEKWGHHITLPAFEIDCAPVTYGQFLAFVEQGGYDNSAYWSGAAQGWWAAQAPQHPASWCKQNGAWQLRWFDAWLPLPHDAPVMHISAYEAQAYCAWAKRALPSAVQWEAAARRGAITWGASVWEWTASDFVPYAGFSADPYQDYSAPWFYTHRELRGGSFATHASLHHPQYRNFFMPHRRDVFAGFRTVSLNTF
jgi:gamma-glutamyl hercynylcysteine S-oxide synthase